MCFVAWIYQAAESEEGPILVVCNFQKQGTPYGGICIFAGGDSIFISITTYVFQDLVMYLILVPKDKLGVKSLT